MVRLTSPAVAVRFSNGLHVSREGRRETVLRWLAWLVDAADYTPIVLCRHDVRELASEVLDDAGLAGASRLISPTSTLVSTEVQPWLTNALEHVQQDEDLHGFVGSTHSDKGASMAAGVRWCHVSDLERRIEGRAFLMGADQEGLR